MVPKLTTVEYDHSCKGARGDGKCGLSSMGRTEGGGGSCMGLQASAKDSNVVGGH